jgi:hypothetical protein
MKILFDQGTPVPLREHLSPHEVLTVFELGWSTLTNGELINRAEPLFDLLITTDQNIRYQQNLHDRMLAILVLLTTSWPRLKSRIPRIFAAVEAIKPGEYRELDVD